MITIYTQGLFKKELVIELKYEYENGSWTNYFNGIADLILYIIRNDENYNITDLCEVINLIENKYYKLKYRSVILCFYQYVHGLAANIIKNVIAQLKKRKFSNNKIK